MNRGVATIWIGMLAATLLAVVPAVVALLTRALNAARRIEQYTAEILTGGVGIAENTANVAALKNTLAAAPHLVTAATSLEANTARIEAVLSSQVMTNGHSDSPEGTV
jgi:hypothetical protein